MEHWASSVWNSNDVQFLCVCVESLGVAQFFDRMFRFEHAVNAYIPSQTYMPRGFGQLGCSGFIVVDAEGNFISRKTKAFLQYGEDAFRHVDDVLKRHLSTVRGRHAAGEAKSKESAPVQSTKTLIGISSMDEEHERCDQALRVLCEKRTSTALQHVIEELENHFAHEEGLMIKHGFGGSATDPFSALNSHVQDHKRILQLARAELQRVHLLNSAVSNSCGDDKSSS